MTPADLVKLARAAKSGKKVTSGLSAAKEAATISNMQQAGELPLPKLINAPQSEALKLAQERAALPVSKGGLGLSKNNTPAQRAKAMGIKTDAYHGTKQDITGAFQPGYDDDLAFVTKSPDFANKWIGKGKHTQRTGEEAKQEVKSAEDMYRDIKSRNVNYDDQLERLKGDEFNAEYDRRSALARAESEKEFGTRGYPDQIHSTVYPLKVEANKTFNPESDMDVMAEFFEKNEIPQNLQDLYASGNYMMYETKPVVEYLKSKGYDSMRLRESTGDDYPTIAVFNPETVRSRFAAFDPFRKDVATATAMGVAAPDLLAEEKESKEKKSRKAQGGLAHMAGGGTPEPKRKSILDLTPLTEAAAAVQNAFKAERSTYGDKGAAMDILNRGIVADTLGGAADLANLPLQGLDWLQSKIPGLSKPASVMDVPSTSPRLSDQPNTALKFPLSTDAPFGGSEAWKELFKKSGVTSKTERPVAEISTSLLAPLAPVVASKAAKVAKAVAPRAGDLAYQFINKQAEAMGLPLEMGVMKPKGGNWLAGSIERVTDPMKSYVPNEESLLRAEAVTPAGAAEARARSIPDAVLNKWIDKKLNPYIKNEMGTPEDQIRLGIERRAVEAETLKETNQAKLDKMAAAIERNKAAGKDTTLTERDLEAAKEQFDEDYQIASQGLYHGTAPENGWDIANLWESEPIQSKRVREGFPDSGLGKHPAAVDWEMKADIEIAPEKVADLLNSEITGWGQIASARVKDNPWMGKAVQQNPDVKAYSLNYRYPDANLEFRHMIDEVKTAMDPASNLPKHLKIAAKDLEKMTVDDVSALSGKISAWRNAQIGKPNLELANNPAVSLYKEYPTANNPKGVSWRQIKRPEGLPDEEADKALRDAIGYEGDIMRHCVGGSGHCEPLLRGETEVYSLRDAKGEPHVTIEVEPAKRPYTINASLFNDGTTRRDSATRAQYRQYVMEWRQRNPDVEELTDENVYQALREAGVPPVSPSIVEIKGKNNRKPKDEYIPFIQDFIKSGNWSNVGDMHHTDLVPFSNDSELAMLLRKAGSKNIPKYLTQDELTALSRWAEKGGDLPTGFAKGGAVRMAEGGAVPKAPSNWTDYLSQHAQEESMRLMGGDTALNPMKDGGSIDDMIRNAVEKANSRNYASGGASLKNIESEEGLAPYGLRHSGEGAKGKGYFGVMPGKRGMVTELSTEAEGVGEHPLIVPTLTREELEYLLAGGDPTEPIYQKAYKHAQGRKSKGKGAFADPSELRHPEPEYADGGVVNIDDLIRKAVTIRNQNA